LIFFRSDILFDLSNALKWYNVAWKNKVFAEKACEHVSPTRKANFIFDYAVKVEIIMCCVRFEVVTREDCVILGFDTMYWGIWLLTFWGTVLPPFSVHPQCYNPK
jgi:hypothetical protein